MASTTTTTTSRLLLAAALLLAAVLAGAVASAAAGGSSCTAGHGLPDPQYPLPGCGWYVSSLVCKVAPSLSEMFRELCCQQLEAIPAACRCTAVRLLVANPLNKGSETEACLVAQARNTRSLVAAAECGLPAVHGWPNCSAPGDE